MKMKGTIENPERDSVSSTPMRDNPRSIQRGSKSDDLSGYGPNSRSMLDTDSAIKIGRLLFVLCLIVAAVILGTFGFYMLRNSERDLADTHFDSIADRALTEASMVLLARRWLTITMSSIIAEVLPNASEYPFVHVPGYERIANGLLNATKSVDTAVAWIVQPDQLDEWEKYAYDFFYNTNKPRPFPNNTGVSSFGRGLWAVNPNSSSPDKRFHNLGKCRFNCSYEILTPIFHVDEGSDPVLMFDLHSDPVRGVAIERMLDCVYEKMNESSSSGDNKDLERTHPYSYQDEADLGCAVTLPMTQVRKFRTRGPASPIFQPIRPVNDRFSVGSPMMNVKCLPLDERHLNDNFLGYRYCDGVNGLGYSLGKCVC